MILTTEHEEKQARRDPLGNPFKPTRVPSLITEQKAPEGMKSEPLSVQGKESEEYKSPTTVEKTQVNQPSEQ